MVEAEHENTTKHENEHKIGHGNEIENETENKIANKNETEPKNIIENNHRYGNDINNNKTN